VEILFRISSALFGKRFVAMNHSKLDKPEVVTIIDPAAPNPPSTFRSTGDK